MLKFTLATFGIVALLLLGALLGGIWVWLSLIYITVFAYGFDRLTPILLANADPDSEFPASDRLSAALAIAHFVVLSIVVYSLAQSDALGLLEKIVLFFATSLFAGQIGHPNAHELIHRSAHPLVHHVHVGTSNDPVSAPKGRGFWRFFGRAWIGSYRAGYTAESKRHKGQGLHPYVMYQLGGAACLLAGFALGGLKGALLWALIGLYAQLQIFLSDYVQHYGLRRKMLDIPLLPQNPNFFMGYDAEIV